MAFLPIAAEAWTCPGCGGGRQIIGPLGHRALRCTKCEGGFGTPFLTHKDHEFLKSIGVKAEAYHCLRSTGTPRAWFKSIAEAETFIRDPANWPTYQPDVARWCLTCGFVHAINPAWFIGGV